MLAEQCRLLESTLGVVPFVKHGVAKIHVEVKRGSIGGNKEGFLSKEEMPSPCSSVFSIYVSPLLLR